MKAGSLFSAAQRILTGQRPVLSIEVTRECPLRCPGCYAYEDQHLGGSVALRDVADFRGDALVLGILELVRQRRPLHVYLVGGDPLVRWREMEALLPRLSDKGILVTLVTSAFRPIPESWSNLPGVRTTISIDGLQPDHDERRKPATYERILKNIAGRRVTVHLTVTGQIVRQPEYLKRFLEFWTPRPEIEAVRVSLFTPQMGSESEECLTLRQRDQVIGELLELRTQFSKLDMPEPLIRAYARPPKSPDQCLFAQITETISADLRTVIAPCQFGGNPDCSRCGCMGSAGLEAVARYKVAGVVPLWKLFQVASGIGSLTQRAHLSSTMIAPARNS